MVAEHAGWQGSGFLDNLHRVQRILFVSENPAWGGSEELWSRCAARMAEMGYSVAAFYRSSNGIPAGRFARNNLRQAAVPLGGIKVFRQARTAWSMFRCVYIFRPHLVLISQGHLLQGVRWMTFCARSGIPYVVVTHSEAECAWWPDKELERCAPALRGARAAYFPCEYTKRVTEKQFGCSLPRASVVHNPVNVAYDARPEWPDQSVYRLACVARLGLREKGQDLLIEVLSLDKWRSRNVEVTLVGRGEHEQSLKRLCAERALKSFYFTGRRDDIEAVWAAHHALVLPSRSEGLPLTLIEAMLCGRVPVVTSVGGICELVEDSRTGFVAKAPTIELFDEALERAWNERERWRDIGARAAERVRLVMPPDPVGVFVDELRRHLDDVCPEC